MKTSLLRKKNFTLLITGKLVSLIGSNLQQFALSLYVLSVTGSATVFASMLSISILPRLLLSPIAGVFGDWFDRKKTIVLLDFANAILIGTFAILYAMNGSLSQLSIYILVILLEVTEIFFGSAMSAVMPSMVEKEELMEANSLNSLVMNLGNMISPIIGAFLYGTFGIQFVFIFNAISFALSAISEMFIAIPKSHNTPEKIDLKVFTTDLKEGITVIKNNKMISSVIGIATILNFAMVPLFGIGLIYVMKEILQVSDLQYGIFQTILSASMIAAPLLSGAITKRFKLGRLSYLSFLLTAILVLAMAVFPSSFMLQLTNSTLFSFWGIVAITFGIGMLVTIFNIAIGTMFNQVVPLEVMGRTSSVFNLAVTVFIPIGQMIFGSLYDILNPELVIASAGIIVLVGTLLYRNILLGFDKDTTKEEEPIMNTAMKQEPALSEV